MPLYSPVCLSSSTANWFEASVFYVLPIDESEIHITHRRNATPLKYATQSNQPIASVETTCLLGNVTICPRYTWTGRQRPRKKTHAWCIHTKCGHARFPYCAQRVSESCLAHLNPPVPVAAIGSWLKSFVVLRVQEVTFEHLTLSHKWFKIAELRDLFTYRIN